jgi:hypothetical protein
MKVSIWQQFSSNHSTRHLIVGKFQTAQNATDAGERLHKVILQIWEWYNAHPEEQEFISESLGHPATEAEQLVAQEYNIAFPEGIDWIAAEDESNIFDSSITTFENHLFLGERWDSMTAIEPFAELVKKLGGELIYPREARQLLYVNLNATAPDEPTAEFIHYQAERFITKNRGGRSVNMRAPWSNFYDGALRSDIEHYEQQLNVFLSPDDSPQHLKMAYTDIKWFEMQLWELEIREFKEGTFSAIRNGNNLIFEKMYFDGPSMGHALPAMITWMRALGCRDVKYTFHTILWEEIWGNLYL